MSQAGRKANITCLFLLQVSTAIVRQPLFAIVYVTCYNSIVRHALCAIIVLAPFYGCLGNNLLQFSISTICARVYYGIFVIQRKLLYSTGFIMLCYMFSHCWLKNALG